MNTRGTTQITENRHFGLQQALALNAGNGMPWHSSDIRLGSDMYYGIVLSARTFRRLSVSPKNRTVFVTVFILGYLVVGDILPR